MEGAIQRQYKRNIGAKDLVETTRVSHSLAPPALVGAYYLRWTARIASLRNCLVIHVCGIDSSLRKGFSALVEREMVIDLRTRRWKWTP